MGPIKILKKYCLGISKIKNYFDIDPADAFLTRDGDYFLDTAKGAAWRLKENRLIHFNSCRCIPDPRPNGVSVYALSKEGSESEIDQYV